MADRQFKIEGIDGWAEKGTAEGREAGTNG